MSPGDIATYVTAVHQNRRPDGSFDHLFERQGAGWRCILFPKRIITAAHYAAIVEKLRSPLNAEQRRVNRLRGRAEDNER